MEDCKRNAGTAVVCDQAASTRDVAALKRRKLVSDDNGGETVFGLPKVVHPQDDVGELGIGSLGVNSPANSAAAEGDACSSSFLRLDRSPAAASSCCSSNESGDVKDAFQLVDLEVKSKFDFETADSTSMNNNHNKNTKKFSETTPSSEVCVDSDETESPPAKPSSGTKIVAKFPPTDEIEEFFATAEKSEQKRFSEKYNYDIVMDSPLEGRYKWVRLKP